MVPRLALLAALMTVAPALHAQPESFYQDQWCDGMSGTSEVVLPDYTRVDCVTEQYAVEVDFAPKWAEAVGQARYYAAMTGKAPAVLLVVAPGEHRFLARFHAASEGLGIRLFTVSK